MKELLPRTFYAFLGRFPKPTGVQVAAAPLIMQGLPVLLCAPTATGKTEGYAAPLSELHLDDLRQDRTRLLVVSPTRALVNDLARRLEAPLQQLRVRLARRTGDHPSALDEVKAGVLLTTPESLDSLLSRHPRWLAEVRAVVLDELHVLHGTPRGDQLRILLERLQRVVGSLGGPPLQRLAASATVANPEALGNLYLGSGARVARVEGQRPLQARLAEVRDPDALLKEVEQACRDWKARKVLLFVGSRQEAEDLGAGFRGRPPFQNQVLVHHGSLSRQERERVEKVFLTAPAALCLATTTLELGIDIGDVDLVVLAAPPPDVAGVLQRVGRGNRRTGLTRVLACHEGPGRKERMEHLLECARTGKLLEAEQPFSPAVLVQQAFSLTYQNPHRFVTGEALAARLPEDLCARYPEARCAQLLEHLARRHWFTRSADRFRPDSKLERLYELGRMHHNFSSESGQEVAVVDRASGRVVGRLHRDAEGRLPDQVSLGGVTREISADKGREVWATSSSAPSSKAFKGRAAPISGLLAGDLARYLEIPPGRLPFCEAGEQRVVGHFQGSVRGALLAEWLRKRATGSGANAFTLWLPTGAPDPFPLDADELEGLLRRRSAALARELELGRWAGELPRDWVMEELLRRLRPFDWAEETRSYRLEPAGPDLAAVLLGLMPPPGDQA